MYKLEELMEISFFKYFKVISDIPRESGNEKEISDYLVNFAKERNLEVIQDKYLNVIIKKEATKGYEHLPTVILQGHMDMVCVKTTDSNHNFEKDPIQLQIIDDMIYGTNTTLGSDDGVALAYSLAILDNDNLKHPPLEIVITTEEESTMLGAMNIDASILKGQLMINLDSNRDDELLVSSTGGIVTIETIKVDFVEIEQDYIPYELKIDGLVGGHSGEEIHKERGNANKILGKLLDRINSLTDLYISSINGGSSSNAIPRNAYATIHVNKDEVNKLEDTFKETSEFIKEELRLVEEKLKITLEKSPDNINKVFSKKSLNSIIDLLVLIPNGVQSMSVGIEGLVESSNNLGTIRTINDEVEIVGEIRSCKKSKRYELEDKIEKLSKLLEFRYSTRDAYPEWNYNDKSIMKDIFLYSYKDIFKNEMKIQAVHAGLETGIFIEKIPNLDIVSFGPNAYELHNPNEHLNIPSCLKSWDILTKALENIINYY
ncbi:aminoacyl-histidine dipeptidase [Romboutsia sp.]|uniref:aminoacyl-histidine dipeptidase n=1 Tax=Romboutsia sp. TaxID=1965302 RepID=UPI003F2C4CB3